MNEQVLTIEQMQYLKDLGVDTSKGSMYWHKTTNTSTGKVENDWYVDINPTVDLPQLTLISRKLETVQTFTLQNVIDLLPKQICPNVTYSLFVDYQEMRVAYCFADKYGMSWLEPTFSFLYQPLLTAAYKMLVWCIKNNYVTTNNEKEQVINNKFCIKCTSELKDYITPFLKEWGYKTTFLGGTFEEEFSVLMLNWNDDENFYGFASENIVKSSKGIVITNAEEFLEKAAMLKGIKYNRKDKNMNQEFTKVSLKPGMVVEYEDGQRRLVLPTEKGLSLIGENGTVGNLNDSFNDDLTHKVFCSRNIVKIYNVKTNCVISDLFKDDFLTLIWEQK